MSPGVDQAVTGFTFLHLRRTGTTSYSCWPLKQNSVSASAAKRDSSHFVSRKTLIFDRATPIRAPFSDESSKPQGRVSVGYVNKPLVPTELLGDLPAVAAGRYPGAADVPTNRDD